MKPRGRRSRARLAAVPAATEVISAGVVMQELGPMMQELGRIKALLERLVELWEPRPAPAPKALALVEGRPQGVVRHLRRPFKKRDG